MWILLCVVVVVVLSVMLLVVFSRANGDFSLMMKGRTPRSVIEDKVVWITGASQGLGEALAKEYAHLGAKLILSARRESELERIKSQLTGIWAVGFQFRSSPIDQFCCSGCMKSYGGEC
jgi:dehydrogenase/reductase SDR family protein 7